MNADALLKYVSGAVAVAAILGGFAMYQSLTELTTIVRIRHEVAEKQIQSIIERSARGDVIISEFRVVQEKISFWEREFQRIREELQMLRAEVRRSNTPQSPRLGEAP